MQNHILEQSVGFIDHVTAASLTMTPWLKFNLGTDSLIPFLESLDMKLPKADLGLLCIAIAISFF